MNCKAGCLRHDYSEPAKAACVEMRIASRDTLDKARAEPHRVCRVVCNRHTGGTVSVISTLNEANMAQHIVRKYGSAPALVTLFRSVHSYSLTSLSIYPLFLHLIKFTCIFIKHIFFYRKVAWFELYKQQRSKLKQKGGGLYTEYSPMQDKMPEISMAGRLGDSDVSSDIPKFVIGQDDDDKDPSQGEYFDFISPNDDDQAVINMVRPLLLKR